MDTFILNCSILGPPKCGKTLLGKNISKDLLAFEKKFIVNLVDNNPNVYWICFDLSKPYSLVEAQEISSNIKGTRILVGCKSDKTVIDEDELVSFYKKNGFDCFLPTSSKTKKNLEELVEMTCFVVKDRIEPIEKFENVPLIEKIEMVEKSIWPCFM